jgi:hypothetical protein
MNCENNNDYAGKVQQQFSRLTDPIKNFSIDFVNSGWVEFFLVSWGGECWPLFGILYHPGLINDECGTISSMSASTLYILIIAGVLLMCV